MEQNEMNEGQQRPQSSGTGFNPERREGFRPRTNSGGNRNNSGKSGGYGGNRNSGSRGGNSYGNRNAGGARPNNRFGSNNRRPVKKDVEKSMYYIALLCPNEVDEQVALYKQKMQDDFGCLVASKSPAHITLINPFFLSDGKFKELVEKLDAFESIITEVDVDVNGFNHFGKRVIFADVQPSINMNALQEQLENYLRNGGFPFIREAQKPFHPHVTIATRDLKETDFDAAYANFEGLSFSASFSTNSLHLMKLVNDKWVHEKEFILK